MRPAPSARNFLLVIHNTLIRKNPCDSVERQKQNKKKSVYTVGKKSYGFCGPSKRELRQLILYLRVHVSVHGLVRNVTNFHLFLRFKTDYERKQKSPQIRLFIGLEGLFSWQGQKESNSQHTVLETVALPIELYPCGAENETRTRDPNLGKVVLYQLSYFRVATRTRLELVTSAVTGRHSNQLNHRAVCQFT